MTVQVVTVRWGAADENADQIGLAFVAFMKLRTNSRRAEDALRRICAGWVLGCRARYRAVICGAGDQSEWRGDAISLRQRRARRKPRCSASRAVKTVHSPDWCVKVFAYCWSKGRW